VGAPPIAQREPEAEHKVAPPAADAPATLPSEHTAGGVSDGDKAAHNADAAAPVHNGEPQPGHAAAL